MHIYTAGLTASSGQAGSLGAKMPAYRDALKDATGHDWSAWAAIAGQPYGSFGLSVVVSGIGDLVDGQMKAAASERFQKLTSDSVGLANGAAQVNLNEIVAMTGDVEETKSLVSWTRAKLAGGQLGAGMGWAVEMMQHITDLTGIGGVVAASSAGEMFTVSWIISVDTGQDYDEANAKIIADAKYLSMLDAAGGFFVPGSSERLISVRIP